MRTLTRRGLLGAASATAVGGPVGATNRESVAVVLALGVDVSGSVTDSRYRLQMRGYHGALLSEEVIAALPAGGVALMLYHWSTFQKERVPWKIVRNREDMKGFCVPILDLPRDTSVWTSTSITGALIFGRHQIEHSPFVGQRSIIDISGDGDESGEGEVKDELLRAVRDSVVSSGIIINGLPILVDVSEVPQSPEGLDVYYGKNVIGGPGAFVLPAQGYKDFRSALIQKLKREMYIS